MYKKYTENENDIKQIDIDSIMEIIMANPDITYGYEGSSSSKLTRIRQIDYLKVSLIIAQAICESGWGNSAIGNNLFGIKVGSDWSGALVTCETNEQSYSTISDFRDYDMVIDGIKDHSDVLTGDHYASVQEACVNKDA